MIVIYPMLTSKGVSSNVVPGIAKVLEKFILIYSIDQVLQDIQNNRQLSLKRAKGRLVATEQKKAPKVRDKKEGEKEGEREKEREKEKERVTKVMELPSPQSLAIEPTWIQYQTPELGTQLLGVKVVSLPVRSDESLASLITQDKNRKFLVRMSTAISRKTIRSFYAACRRLRVPFIRNMALTGDPRYDILWASSKYGTKAFALLNLADIEEESFFDVPRNIIKLQKLGWGSFIAADEPNKRAIFCMQQFGGICTSVAYGFIYSSLTAEHGKVYKDLEEVRRSATPFFRLKLNKKKLFSECLACSKMSKYKIKEQAFSPFLKSLTSDKIRKVFLSLPSATGDLLGVPLIPFSKVFGIYKRISPNFIRSYNISKQVIENSTTIPDKLVESVASIIAFSSTYKVDDFMKRTKVNLRRIVLAARSMGEVTEDVLGYQRIILLSLASVIPSLTIKPEVLGKFTCSKISKLLSRMPVSRSDILIPTTLVILNWLIRGGR